MHAPFVHNLLTNLPKRPMDAAQGKTSPSIGHAGSEAITNSIIRALAILDVGPTLADEIVAGNMQAYRPEQHVDQPMGYAANTDSIVHDGGPNGPLRPGRRSVEGGNDAATSRLSMGQCKPVKQVADADWDLAGSAVPGRQFENPELFKVSDAGLQNHIYNSSEWCKNHWLDAARLGPTDKGRFHIGYAKYFGPAGYAVVLAMRALIKQINGWIDEQLKHVKQRMKQQLMLGMVTLIDSISGVDSRDQKNRTIGDALADVGEGVVGFEHQTSLEARLLPGGDLAGLTDAELAPIVGPVRPAPGGGWIAQNPLAPSHSELAKDHAPYTDLHTHAHGSAARNAVSLGHDHGELLNPGQHQSGVKHDNSEGSIFGGLARALATEADRHVLRQAEIVWKDRGSLYGDGKGLDTSTMEVDHDSFGKQADERATAEGKRAKKTGYKFAQTDAANATMMSKPGVRELLELVDLIIAQPEDSTWWKTAAETYISAHPDEVARHIRERNAVRGNRRRVTT